MEAGKQLELYTGPAWPRPFFFLGSLRRTDLRAVGGYDEEFTSPGYDDNWFGDCLQFGRGLHPVIHEQVHGQHQKHREIGAMVEAHLASAQLYAQKKVRGKYAATRSGLRTVKTFAEWIRYYKVIAHRNLDQWS